MVVWRQPRASRCGCQSVIRIFVLFANRRRSSFANHIKLIACPIAISRVTYVPISNSPQPHADSLVDYATRLRSINLPLRLLTENEVFRLMVWANPTNDPKRGSDQVGTTLATLFEVRLIQFGHALCLTMYRLLGFSLSARCGKSIQQSQFIFRKGSRVLSSVMRCQS